MSHLFPVDTCVVACSGPSLNKVDVFSLGIPVCAISTAIRSIPNPNYWFIADHLNEMHGQQGKTAWMDEKIIKVVPEKSLRSQGKGVIQHPYMENREANKQYETLLFDPSKPLLRGPHKTLTFALQWLHVSGVKKLIFAGNDLDAENFESKYSYQLENYDKKKQHNFKKTLDQIKEALFKWYPVAKSKGFEWYSWECGPVFESLVPKFNKEVLSQVTFQNKKSIPIVTEIYNEPTIVESDVSQREYLRLVNENRSKEKTKEKVNMNLYFDLLHKRKK
jgi:hypothetical protein